MQKIILVGLLFFSLIAVSQGGTLTDANDIKIAREINASLSAL